MVLIIDAYVEDFVTDFIKIMKILNTNKEIMDKLREEKVPDKISDKLYTCFPPDNLKLFFNLDTFERKIEFIRETFIEILMRDKEGNRMAKAVLSTTLNGLINYMKFITNNDQKKIDILNQIEDGLKVVVKYESFANEFFINNTT